MSAYKNKINLGGNKKINALVMLASRTNNLKFPKTDRRILSELKSELPYFSNAYAKQASKVKQVSTSEMIPMNDRVRQTEVMKYIKQGDVETREIYTVYYRGSYYIIEGNEVFWLIINCFEREKSIRVNVFDYEKALANYKEEMLQRGADAGISGPQIALRSHKLRASRSLRRKFLYKGIDNIYT